MLNNEINHKPITRVNNNKGEAMHVHEDYRNHPYRSPTLMSDQKQQTEEDLALMT